MDPIEPDWGGWSSITEAGESNMSVDSFQKQEDSNMSIGDSRSDSVYGGSNVGGEEEYFSGLGVYDGYDSYQDGSGSSSDEGDDEDDETYFPASNKQKTQYRFMNGKDGMATCERCGSVGIKHAFYSKSKRFCSLSCSRSFATAKREGKPLTTFDKTQQKKIPGKKMNIPSKLPQPVQSLYPKTVTKRPGGMKGFDWGPYLAQTGSDAAPITCFKHCPMSDHWQNINTGMKVELENHLCDIHAFWIATVVKVAGYKALMRFEGFGNESTYDFWINLCTQDVHPVGWCATVGKPLVPPKSIQDKYIDWKEYLIKRLTGARTLPSNFYNKVVECINDIPIKKGMQLEVVDKMCVSAMKVAKVQEVVGGRLRLHYTDSKEEIDEFWCHMRSPLVHPIGWSQTSGHKLHATQEYRSKCLNKITMDKYDPDDVTPDMFEKKKEPPHGAKFQEGMKLEAIDPLNLSAICVATVMKVLKNNYLMIGIDGSIAQNGTDWFNYHSTSPCIFPVGFCEVNGIELTPPRGYKGQFKWFEYLRQTKSSAAPVKLFDKEIPKHGFKPANKVEAVDLMEPRLICVATVSRVVGRLLRIHFDGWEVTYDQWVDCETADLYPVGWCEVMNYGLEGPRVKIEPISPVPVVPKLVKESPFSKKRKGKTQIYKGPRKSKSKRKPKLSPTGLPLGELGNIKTESNSSFSSQFESTIKVKTEVEDVDFPPSLSPHQSFSDEKSIRSGSNESPSSKPSVTKTALSNLLMSKSGGTNLVDSTKSSQLAQRHLTIPPDQWTVSDVCYFLKVNDCASFWESFVRSKVDGKKLLELTKDQISSLTGMKIGASIKMTEMIQQLKTRAQKS
ncbi:MBT domain-containing protein 1-like isoform X1 [Mytilus edulis]|uniref:MBT domain-containing protein 1-like isoform X1 n=1 Tax=Mytilus edulis TaxID=6550 RepID=UPI0039F039F2